MKPIQITLEIEIGLIYNNVNVKFLHLSDNYKIRGGYFFERKKTSTDTTLVGGTFNIWFIDCSNGNSYPILRS